MIHVQFPKSSEQIRPSDLPPLVKYGQGRGGEHESGPLETPQTFSEKLRKAGLAEKAEAELPPVVSREGFRAGVLSAIAGGVIIACFYLAWGIVAACLFTAVCIGFLAGMVMTEGWK